MENTELLRDRALGCFMGLAVGDALGAPAEFKEPGEFEPITDYRAGGPFNLPAGYWTDDTSMALCLADSILYKDAIDPDTLMYRFCRWFLVGENSSTGRCFDIGNTTRKALWTYHTTKEYKPASNHFAESGNGSIMRLAPVVVRWFADPVLVVTNAVAQGITTHGSNACISACMELASMCAKAVRGEDIMSELTEFAASIDGVPNTGYVVDTMVAAKWAVGHTTNFDDAVLAAANLGGDSDTIAAVAGQIAGAIYGLSSIRPDWIKNLHRSTDLLNLANRLYDRSTQ